VTDSSSGIEPSHVRLWEFLRDRQEQIIGDWKARMRALSPARDLSDAAIVDHLPQILTRIAAIVESVHTGEAASLGSFAQDHAVDRLGRGFDLDQIVTEYSLLRRSILDLWQARIGPTIDLGELGHLDVAFDESIRQAVARYAAARDKLLKAVNRISEAALGSSDVETFLRSLLRATLESTESVDTAIVFLREGDTLRARAAVGLEEDLERDFTVTIPEGLAGHIAAERKPVFFKDASRDPHVKSEVIRAKGVHAVYGVPMMRDDKVIGVAHIGSLTAFEFSEEDKLLFRTTVSRATSVVIKAQLVDDLRRAETAHRFLSDASKQLAESLDYRITLQRIARLAVPAIADWCVVHLVENGTSRRVSVAHTDPAKERLAEELEARYPTDPHAATGIPNVARTGRPEWQPEITDAALAATAHDAEHLRILRELGIKSYIIVPIVSRGETFGTIALVTAESGRRYSATDLELAEDLARRAATAIENARLYTDAQQAVLIRERVLAIVSHDLRNQLGVVAMGANLLSRKAAAIDESDIRKPIETIQRTATSMQHLVGDLLDMASIQAGRLSFEMQPAEIKPILLEGYENQEPTAREKGLRLRAQLEVDGLEVLCDRDRILQVLANLLGNAIKFCETGDTITLRAERRDGDVLIAVSDTGPGIPRNELDKIFEAYRTIEHARHGRTGTGLGLYITKGIVERHGGRIWVESELGAGTTFFLTLPLA